MPQRLGVLLDVAAVHHGVFRYDDARERGVTRATIDGLRRAGVVELLGSRVYRVRGAPVTWRNRLTCGVWATGPLTLASHRSAAALWGLLEPRGIEVLTPMSTGGCPPAVTVHRTRCLSGADLGCLEQIPVTGIERTLIDLAAVVPMGRVARTMDEAAERELTTPRRILEHLRTMPTRGRSGVRILRVLLEERLDLAPGEMNPFESMMDRLLRSADLPAFVRQHPLDLGGSRYYLDFAFPTHKVAIECDGMLGHASASAQSYDLARQNAILADGWSLRRFSWSSLRLEREATLGLIREALLDSGWNPPAGRAN